MTPVRQYMKNATLSSNVSSSSANCPDIPDWLRRWFKKLYYSISCVYVYNIYFIYDIRASTNRKSKCVCVCARAGL